MRINQTAVKTYSARLSRPPSLPENHDLRGDGQICHCSVEDTLWEATRNTLWEATLSPIFWKIAVGDASHKFWKIAVRDGSHKWMNRMFSTRQFPTYFPDAHTDKSTLGSSD